MIVNRDEIIKRARELRVKGHSHRQIAKDLNISLGTAVIFTKDIKITWRQHVALMKNTGIFRHAHEDRSKWSARGSANWLSHIKYSRETLLKMIIDFYNQNQRIPTKREFYSHWQAYRRVFGNWNGAIIEAGYMPNSERFTRKVIANDGHVCDSLAEKIIDDWLHRRKISHICHIYYPGQNKFRTDFFVKNKYWVEFLGLHNQLESYDRVYQKKLEVARKNGIKIIELYPQDLFPRNKLSEKLDFLLE